MIIPKPITHYLDVPGFNNSKHLDALSEFAAKVPAGGRVLEIGCAWGCSTWVLLDSLQEGVELHTCDTFGMNNINLKRKHFQGVMKKHKHNTAVSYAMNMYLEEQENAQRKVFNWVIAQHSRRFKLKHTVHQKPSLQLLKNDTNWSMVYIDGLHSYDNVLAELSYLKKVYLLCGDDYHPAHEGTMKAIDEFRSNNKRLFKHHPFESRSGFWTMIKEN